MEYANFTNDKVSSKKRRQINQVIERVNLLENFHKNSTFEDYLKIDFFQSNEWKENKFIVFTVQSKFKLISIS